MRCTAAGVKFGPNGRAERRRARTYHRDGVVPAVGGHGEVEGRDDADDAERVPALEQRVPGALAGNDAAGQHAGQPHGVVADVHVLLHLADPLGQNLAHLEADQLPQGLELVPE